MMGDDDLEAALHLPSVFLEPGVRDLRDLEAAADTMTDTMLRLSEGRLDLSLDDEDDLPGPGDPSPPVPKRTPSAPSFGLGLSRQKAFAGSSVLTDSELEVQHEKRGRCSAALARMMRRVRVRRDENGQR